MTLTWKTAGHLLMAQADGAELAVRIAGGHPRYTIRQPAPGGSALVASGTAPTLAAAMAAAERAHRAAQPRTGTRAP